MSVWIDLDCVAHGTEADLALLALAHMENLLVYCSSRGGTETRVKGRGYPLKGARFYDTDLNSALALGLAERNASADALGIAHPECWKNAMAITRVNALREQVAGVRYCDASPTLRNLAAVGQRILRAWKGQG